MILPAPNFLLNKPTTLKLNNVPALRAITLLHRHIQSLAGLSFTQLRVSCITQLLLLNIPMEARLEAPALPVALCDGFIRPDETHITVRCHDRTFKRVTVLDETDHILFTAESKGATSLSWRRTVLDASGRALFDLRHLGYTLKNKWTVETGEGETMCSLKHADLRARSALEGIVHQNVAHGGSKDVVVDLRPKDRSALTSFVDIQGATVAEIRLVEDNDLVNLDTADRTVWKARIAKGVDISLVSFSFLVSYLKRWSIIC